MWHVSVYPTIDPKTHFEKKSYLGKVVLVTGASRGIGRDVARHYARAGASVTLVSRDQAALQAVKTTILEELPEAQVLVHIADVKDFTQAGSAVEATVLHFGRLDVLVANAGASTPITASRHSNRLVYLV